MVHQFDRHRTELFFNETFGKLVAPQRAAFATVTELCWKR
jgi:hypothetical protein